MDQSILNNLEQKREKRALSNERWRWTLFVMLAAGIATNVYVQFSSTIDIFAFFIPIVSFVALVSVVSMKFAKTSQQAKGIGKVLVVVTTLTFIVAFIVIR
jgi:hypothetical protein